MNLRYFGLSNDPLYFFSQIARDYESGKITEIPIIVKAAFVDKWQTDGIGMQLYGQTKKDFDKMPGDELYDKILPNLLVKVDKHRYAVGVERCLPLITVWNLYSLSYEPMAQISWTDILLSYMKKFWDTTPISVTHDLEGDSLYQYLDGLASQIDWNLSPTIASLQ